MISIKVPPLGESIVEATVSRWLKQEGEAVSAGETLVELETDKVTVEVPATTSGVLVRRAQKEGDVVALGAVLGELDETAAGTAAAPPAARPTAAPPAPPAPQTNEAPAPAGAATAATREAPPRASPGARRLAADEGVDLADVPGTGRGGVVSKPDVVEYVGSGQRVATSEQRSATSEQQAVSEQRPASIPTPAAPPAAQAPAAPAAPVPTPARPPVAESQPKPVAAPPSAVRHPPSERETREKMSTRRKRIAEHLLESQHATAHLTTFNEIDMSQIEALRARIRDKVEKETGVRLSMMPFFVKAAIMALRQYPVVNAQIDGDAIVYRHYVNMGIAVASDAGLVVPNIKDADRKGILDLARDIGSVAKKARDGKLTMDDLTGGTFTITNGGVFGSLVSTPIINYPQVAILGLHKVQDRPVAVDGQVVVRPMMYVALSYDHRIIDGQQAVLFLVRVKELMEDPASMLVG